MNIRIVLIDQINAAAYNLGLTFSQGCVVSKVEAKHRGVLAVLNPLCGTKK